VNSRTVRFLKVDRPLRLVVLDIDLDRFAAVDTKQYNGEFALKN